VALPREAPDARSSYDRSGRTGVIVQHPAAESRHEATERRLDEPTSATIAVLESRLREEARLEGVHLAAREIAHLLNNDLAVAVGFVDLLQTHSDLPEYLRDLMVDAISSLDAAARHIEEMQRVERVVVKETPAGQSLDLERSRSA
jgi:signal transduction histidine kinase